MKVSKVKSELDGKCHSSTMSVRCLEVHEKHKCYTFLTPCLDFTIILKSLTTVSEMWSINQDKLGIRKSVDIISEAEYKYESFYLSSQQKKKKKKKDKKTKVGVVRQTAHKLIELIHHSLLFVSWWYQLCFWWPQTESWSCMKAPADAGVTMMFSWDVVMIKSLLLFL